jgi:hypothetical protein
VAGLVGHPGTCGAGLPTVDDLDGLAPGHRLGAQPQGLLAFARGEVVVPVRRG